MTTKVDHNYPTTGALVATDEDTGLPIAEVVVRVYEADEYPPATDVQETWIAQTITDESGEWKDPMYLPDGTDWIVEFSKRLMYTTTTSEIST